MGFENNNFSNNEAGVAMVQWYGGCEEGYHEKGKQSGRLAGYYGLIRTNDTKERNERDFRVFTGMLMNIYIDDFKTTLFYIKKSMIKIFKTQNDAIL